MQTKTIKEINKEMQDTIGTSAKRKTKTIKEINEGMQQVLKNERDVQKKKPLLPAKRGRGHPPDAKNKVKKQDKK